MASKNKNRVTNLQQLQNRSEELKDAGYVAVRPDAFTPFKNGGRIT
jgi:dienelactone hydrolase